MKDNILIEGKVRSTLLRFSLPFLFTYILENLYSAVDIGVVGHFSSSEAVSAMTTGGQVMNTVLMLSLGLCTSLTVLVGRKAGEKDIDGIKRIVGNTITILGVLAIILMCVVVFGAKQIVSIMQTPGQAVPDAIDYLVICGFEIPFIMGYNIVGELFHGLGDSRTPLIFVAIASVIHVCIAVALVGGLGMGAAGTALATVISQAIGCILAVAYLYIKNPEIRISFKDMKLKRYITADILKIGMPMVLYYLQKCISYLIVTAIINDRGVIASASAGVTETLMGFLVMLPSAIASSMSVMVAQNLGAGKRERVNKTLNWGLQVCVGFGIVVCICCQLAPQTLIGLFTKDSNVISTATLYLSSYSIDCILVGITCCLNAYFIGHGKSFICMFHLIVAAFCGRIPLSLILSRLPGTTLWHIGFASPAGSVESIIILVIFFIHFTKKQQTKIS